jgi:hypothetical protein
MLRLSCLFIALLPLVSTASVAQNEIAREQSSLYGITEFGVVVNVEIPGDLKSEHLSASGIRRSIEENLSELPVSILSDETLKESDSYPILHIHINVMEAANNTYPFSIELNFYQPIKLILNRDLQTMGVTWNKGQIGIVSHNMMHVIAEEAVYTSNLFKDAFLLVN